MLRKCPMQNLWIFISLSYWPYYWLLFIRRIGVSASKLELWRKVEYSEDQLDGYVAEAKSSAFLKEYYKFHHKERPKDKYLPIFITSLFSFLLVLFIVQFLWPGTFYERLIKIIIIGDAKTGTSTFMRKIWVLIFFIHSFFLHLIITLTVFEQHHQPIPDPEPQLTEPIDIVIKRVAYKGTSIQLQVVWYRWHYIVC